MIIRVQSTDLSGAQRFVLRLITEWGSGAGRVGGVTLFGFPLPRPRRRPLPAEELLMWTPHGCTLIVPAGFGSVQHGALDTPPTGRWRVGERAADLRTPKSAPNPLLHARKLRTELAAVFRRAGLSEQVDILVVLIPKTGSRISWTPPAPEPGVEMILARIGQPASFLEYFARPPAEMTHWRAGDLAQAFDLLAIADKLPEPEDLAEEGFPAGPSRAAESRARPGRASLLPRRAKSPRRGPPAGAVPATDEAGASTVSAAAAADAEESASTVPAGHSGSAAAPRVESIRRSVPDRRDASVTDRGLPTGPLGDVRTATGSRAGWPGAARRSTVGTTSSDSRRLSEPGAETAGDAAASSGGLVARAAVRVFGRRAPAARTAGAPEPHSPIAAEHGVGTDSHPVGMEPSADIDRSPAAAPAGPGTVAATHRDDAARVGGTGAAVVDGTEANGAHVVLGRHTGAAAAEAADVAVESRVSRVVGAASSDPAVSVGARPAHGTALPSDVAAGPVQRPPESRQRSTRPGFGQAAVLSKDGAVRSGRRRLGAALTTGVANGSDAVGSSVARRRRGSAGPVASAPRDPGRTTPQGPGRRRGLRYPATVATAAVAVAAVAATVFAASGFARFDVAEYGALCAGGSGFSSAAPYRNGGTSPVYLGSELGGLTTLGPSAVWHPVDAGTVQLVACVSEERRAELVRTCQYPAAPGQPVGRTLNLFAVVYRLSLREARTGNVVTQREVVGDRFAADPTVRETDTCRAATGAPEDGLPGRRHSRLSVQQIRDILTPFVDPASGRVRAAR